MYGVSIALCFIKILFGSIFEIANFVAYENEIQLKLNRLVSGTFVQNTSITLQIADDF